MRVKGKNEPSLVANFGRGRPFFEGEIRFVTNLRWEMQIFGRRAPISSPFFEEIY